MKSWFLIALGLAGMAFAAEDGKAPAGVEAGKKPAVMRFYADAITKDGEFAMVRYSTADFQAIAHGGLKLSVEAGRVRVSMRKSVEISTDPSGPSVVTSDEWSGDVPAGELVVVIGKGERAVDFKPVAGTDGKVLCREVKVMLLDRATPEIVELPDTSLAKLAETVKNAKPQ